MKIPEKYTVLENLIKSVINSSWNYLFMARHIQQFNETTS